MKGFQGATSERSLQVPDRWPECPNVGSVVDDTFLPFKTPLDDTFRHVVPRGAEFRPAHVPHRDQIRVWVDLTNTSRYYDRRQAAGRYVKMECRGHGECPTAEQTAEFIRQVGSDREGLVAVHCTHGFNRTGFLVVAFLVEVRAFQLQHALEAFRQARQPGIYKQEYIRVLCERYGDKGLPIPLAPSRPVWNLEDSVSGRSKREQDSNDRQSKKRSEQENNNQRHPKRMRDQEYIDQRHPKRMRDQEYNDQRPIKKMKEEQAPVFMPGVPGVHPLHGSKLAQVRLQLQQLCGLPRPGFPGSQPVSMDRDNLRLLASTAYKVTWKADGTRYMMLIAGRDEVYLVDRKNCVFQARGLSFPLRKNPEEHTSATLVDGEMVMDRVDGRDVPRFLAYDIVWFQGQHVGGCDLNTRLLCIQRELVEPRMEAMRRGAIDRSLEPFSVRPKNFYDVAATRVLLGEEFVRQLPHETDGLVFQPVATPYTAGTCRDTLKWKPGELNSVDFRLVIPDRAPQGELLAGQLFVGGQDFPFGEIRKNLRHLKQFNHKIIECALQDNEWTFLRERADKSQPNYVTTARSVCKSISQPVTKDLLLHFIDSLGQQPQGPAVD